MNGWLVIGFNFYITKDGLEIYVCNYFLIIMTIHFFSRLVLRIRAEAERCLIALGGKFGCEPDKAVELLKHAKNLGLTVAGISFHVGTGCHETQAYPRAIHIAAEVIDEAQKNGVRIQYLDIGGGFPGDSLEMFEKVSYKIQRSQ